MNDKIDEKEKNNLIVDKLNEIKRASYAYDYERYMGSNPLWLKEQIIDIILFLNDVYLIPQKDEYYIIEGVHTNSHLKLNIARMRKMRIYTNKGKKVFKKLYRYEYHKFDENIANYMRTVSWSFLEPYNFTIIKKTM